MRRLLRRPILSRPDLRQRLTDALGALSLVILFAAALHLPLPA